MSTSEIDNSQGPSRNWVFKAALWVIAGVTGLLLGVGTRPVTASGQAQTKQSAVKELVADSFRFDNFLSRDERPAPQASAKVAAAPRRYVLPTALQLVVNRKPEPVRVEICSNLVRPGRRPWPQLAVHPGDVRIEQYIRGAERLRDQQQAMVRHLLEAAPHFAHGKNEMKMLQVMEHSIEAQMSQASSSCPAPVSIHIGEPPTAPLPPAPARSEAIDTVIP